MASACSSEDWGHVNKKHSLQSKIPTRCSLGWFKWKTPEKLKDRRKIPRRHDLPDWSSLKTFPLWENAKIDCYSLKRHPGIHGGWFALLISSPFIVATWKLCSNSDLRKLATTLIEASLGIIFFYLHLLKNERRRAEYILYEFSASSWCQIVRLFRKTFPLEPFRDNGHAVRCQIVKLGFRPRHS